MDNIIKHIDFDHRCLRENVCRDGTFENETADGRLLNPGHAIEACWFLREYVSKYGDIDLYEVVVNRMNMNELTRNVFEWSFERGWDTQNGGIYAFRDALNAPLVQLESNMKLWWPCNEAMICSCLLFKDSVANNDDVQMVRDWNTVELICRYALNAFSDPNNGAWYGYLNENSEIELAIKGGPYFGFFHVPRSLMFCVNILDDIINEMKWLLKSKL